MSDVCWNCKGHGTYGDGRVPGCTRCGKVLDPDAFERAAYERGLRRGMAIAREYDESLCPFTHGPPDTVDWEAATKQMEREIEEAKR